MKRRKHRRSGYAIRVRRPDTTRYAGPILCTICHKEFMPQGSLTVCDSCSSTIINADNSELKAIINKLFRRR